jgi:hypothetical protein
VKCDNRACGRRVIDEEVDIPRVYERKECRM